jgi:AcrR family transcriptional regulator
MSPARRPADAPVTRPVRDRRARTYRALLGEALNLVRRGRIPSVAEVAQTAGVSRATAYRYFPNRSVLVSALIDEALQPVRSVNAQGADGQERLHDLFERTYPRFSEYEPHMRAALMMALEHQSLEAAGLLEEEAFRRGNRRDILRRTAAPLREQLGARSFERLLRALSLFYGIEPYVVLKDIWGSSNREVEAMSRWMLDAVVEKALRDAPARGRRGGPASTATGGTGSSGRRRR